MTLRGVVFDLDGLLVDTEAIYCRAWQTAAAEQEETLATAQYVSLVLGRSNEEGERNVCGTFRKTFDAERFRVRRTQAFRDALRATPAERLQKPGASDLLRYLADKGVRVTVASSSHTDDVLDSLAAAELDGFFHPPSIVTGDHVVRAKPDPEIYLTGAAKLSLSPGDCIALEDSSPGVMAASAAGMKVVGVPDMTAFPPDVAEKCTRVCHSLADVHALWSQL